jgi:hypothetical protein
MQKGEAAEKRKDEQEQTGATDQLPLEDLLEEEDYDQMQEVLPLEQESGRRPVSPTAVILLLGIALVLAGFAVIVAAAVPKVFHPASLFFVAGFGLFAVGVLAVGAAWHRLN